MQQQIQPVQGPERIGSLDFLRGIAVLGILVINIETFAYPDPWSPHKFGFVDSTDVWTRFWVYFLGQGKFFGMFTLLFGVGFYIFLERLEQKGIGLKAMDIYARRLLWLFIFGVVHAYLIWHGDILYHYAACGFLLFPFRSLSTKKLLLILLIPAGLLLFNSYEQVTRTKNQYSEFTNANSKAVEARTPADLEKISRWKDLTSKKEAYTRKTVAPRKTYWQSISISLNAENISLHKGGILFQGILFRTLIMMMVDNEQLQPRTA